MKYLKKYQATKQRIVEIAKTCHDDKVLIDELEEFENLLLGKSKVPELEPEKYKMLFEKSGDCIFILSLEGNIIAVNSTACKKYQDRKSVV